MRREGASYGDIQKVLGISKSTLSYMLQNVVLSTSQIKILEDRQKVNRDLFTDKVRNGGWLSLEQRRENGRNQPRTTAQITALLDSSKKANLSYCIEHEKKLRDVLEKLFGVSLRKEIVAGRYIDFASENILIEHSYDNGKGMNDIAKRFADVAASGDKRKRIAYINQKHFGKKRRARFAALDVEVHNVDELRPYL